MKKTGSFTEVSYDKKSLTPVARKMGPGRYSLDTRRSVTPGPGWEREVEVTTIAKMPHLLYRETWERERQAKLNLGPGRYNSKDFIQELSDRVHSARGILELYEPRFQEKGKGKIKTPGPGTYGKDGVPDRLIEESKDKFHGKIPSFEWGKNLNRSLPLVGSSVAPGTYEYTPELDERTQKQVGLRGPYDLFTASRSAPITNGHFARQKPVRNRGPADYEQKSFVEDLSHSSHTHIGEFKKLDQYPKVPGERIFFTKPTQAPVDPSRPGPGYYESNPGAISVSGENSAPFQQSAERFDERAKIMMMGPSVKNVGVGRYDLTKYDKHQPKNGNKSSFNSKVPILLEPTLDKIIKERLKPHVPSAKKRVLKTKSRVIEDAILSKKMLNQ